MKGTYDDKKIEFEIQFNYDEQGINSRSVLDFNDAYGIPANDILKRKGCKSFHLYSHRKIKALIPEEVQKAEFKSIKVTDEMTFEEAVENYLTNTKNYEKFNDVQKIHALCFLERYCMKHKETKKVNKKYIKGHK